MQENETSVTPVVRLESNELLFGFMPCARGNGRATSFVAPIRLDRQPPKKEEKVAKVVQDIEPMMAMSSPVPPPREEVSSEAGSALSLHDAMPGHCAPIGHGLFRGARLVSCRISAIGDDQTLAHMLIVCQ